MRKIWQKIWSKNSSKNLVLVADMLFLGMLAVTAMADESGNGMQGAGDASAQGAGDLVRLMGKTETQQEAALNTGNILRLTNNKNEIIRLDQDAASVIVNNPEHISVMLDSPRLLIVMPRQTGATSFTVLNAAGDIILEKEVIVSNVKPNYVRIRKICSGSSTDCVPASYYYCPDGCYEVTAAGGAANTQVPAVASSSGGSATSAPAGADGSPPPPSATESPSVVVPQQQGTEP